MKNLGRIFLSILAIVLVTTPPVFAQQLPDEAVMVDSDQVVLVALKGHSTASTQIKITPKWDGLTEISLSAKPLVVDATVDPTISFFPASFADPQKDTELPVTITVQNTSGYPATGSWSGMLVIECKSASTASVFVEVPLTVVWEAFSVNVDAITLYTDTEPDWASSSRFELIPNLDGLTIELGVEAVDQDDGKVKDRIALSQSKFENRSKGEKLAVTLSIENAQKPGIGTWEGMLTIHCSGVATDTLKIPITVIWQTFAVTPIEISSTLTRGESSTTFSITPMQSGLSDINFKIKEPLRVVSTDTLKDQIPLKPGQFTFTPASIQTPPAGKSQAVSLKVDNITQAGIWTGEVELQWSTSVATHSVSIPVTVTIQTVPTLVLQSPDKILIKDTNADKDIARNITLRETKGGSPVEGITLEMEVLYTEDRTQQLATESITLAVPTATIAGSSRADIGLTFNLKGAKSGTYSGNLIVRSKNADEVKIPVQVVVKDPPGWVIFWLGFGVLIGLILNWYIGTQKPRDEIWARIGKLKDLLGADERFEKYCGKKIRLKITIAEDALAHGLLAEAKKELEAV
ncbi:MAG TPA: hypothetical protein VFF78_01810, partial [Anaerolineaceae bacterium]|nr:hypothetical protein [Anaerolineaceae bacterium]